ncbi:MAG: class I SAM-dependent methyltransferase [Acidobacteria bacterium]|nr:MAG: class I SAM-dependent methyltransferase [Acidobacteriota bacterium]
MGSDVNLYDTHYGQLAAAAQAEVRHETYDEDLGQSSWIMLAEAREWFRLLRLDAESRVLEVGCGSGGITRRLAAETGASAVGVDINPHGIDAAAASAAREGLSPRVSFQLIDAGKRLPFADASFDAIFCNDAINHLPRRAELFADWHRVLSPGGRLLFTDPIVVTGAVTSEEIRIRSSIGFYLFVPAGCNERLLEQAGFVVQEIRDVTDAEASVSARWRDARARRRDALIALEGEHGFQVLQQFLDTVHTLSAERRLSRFAYLASR